MNDKSIENHPLQPFLPKHTKLLMLGSFPPQQKRWCIHFYYPNFNNDMWRILGILFFNNKMQFVDQKNKTCYKEEIIEFLNSEGIGIYDTATSIRRLQDNASDKFLEVVEPTDIKRLLDQIPECQAIITTGEKATSTLQEQLDIDQAPKIGEFVSFTYNTRNLRLYRMPSSSRAYPLKVEKKAELYRIAYQEYYKLKNTDL